MSEDREQEVVAQWLDRHRVLWCHVPNGGQRSAVTGARLKRLGVKRGVPDILIFDAPPAHHTSIGVAIELKAGKGRATVEQRDWLAELGRRGWVAFVAVGASDAIGRLTVLGYGGRRE